MRRTEDNCVGCSTIYGSCLGAGCPNRNQIVLVCDKCEADVDKLYEYEGEELCQECLLDTVPQVEV